MNCPKCGANVKPGARFCADCGVNFESFAQQNVAVSGQQMSTASPQVTYANGGQPQVQTLQQRNPQKTVAIACLVVIGIVIAVIAGLLFWKSFSTKELVLNADVIKDEALLNTLTVSYDKDGDGKLSEEELGDVQEVELDTGDDYSYLYLFWNLRSVDVKNTEVKHLDLSQNSKLEDANLKDATSVEEIELPEVENYDNIILPDNENTEVVFPKNSEYEVKYVPKKVTESTYNKTQYDFKSIEKTTTYTQDVQSATRINSLTSQEQGGGEQKITYSYDDFGRITSWGQSKEIQYDDNNQVKLENATINGLSGSMQAAYGDGGNVLNVSNVAEVKYEEGATYLVTTGLDKVSTYWKWDASKLNEAFRHPETNGAYYARWKYAWEGDSVKSMTLESLIADTEGSKMSLNSLEATSSMSGRSKENVTFNYESDKLAKATYEHGFEQNFSYDSHGNLKTVSSTGTSSVMLIDVTTNCSVEYARVICKKNETPLNFIDLPGIDKKGLFNQALDTRGITLCGSVSQYTAFNQDFSGKFWWDEENIINNQVEATERKKTKMNKSEDNELADANSQAEQKESEGDKIARLTKQLQDEGYDTVIQGELKRHVDATQYGTNIIYFVRSATPISFAAHSAGAGNRLNTKETDTFRIAYGEEGDENDAKYAGMEGHVVLLGCKNDNNNYWQSDSGCSGTLNRNHSSAECELNNSGHPVLIKDSKVLDLSS